MKKDELKNLAIKVIPKFIMNYLRRRNINPEFANFILTSAVEYSKKINGDLSSFDRRLNRLIMNCNNDCNSIIQDILTAFMPEYEKNLFQYYKNQEYLIFYRFLTYPFSSNLYSYIRPYEKGLSYFKCCDILDYGAGIPYGLIFCLHNNRKNINSITLVDLDLIHVDFVRFLIEKIDPDIKLNIYKLTDTDTFPTMEGAYNLFFGKDIFEHLSDPQKNLTELMSYSKPESVCYFDFHDHGEKIYQHISPNIEYLSGEMKNIGFQNLGKVHSLSEFVRKI